MATPAPMIDMRDGEIFVTNGASIRRAIRNKVSNDLGPEMQTCMKEVQGELDQLDSEERAGLLLAMFMTTDKSPPVLLASACIARAAVLAAEIEELTILANNIAQDPKTLFQLSLEQVKRYGLGGAPDAQ